MSNTTPEKIYTCLMTVGRRGCGARFKSWDELVEHEKTHAAPSSNLVTLVEVIDFMGRRCIGVNQSADAARWDLIKRARAHETIDYAARDAEARWLLSHAITRETRIDWTNRRDAWLGRPLSYPEYGVKASAPPCLRDPKFDNNLQGPCSAGACQWPKCNGSATLPHLDTCGLKYGGTRCTCGLQSELRSQE